MFYFDFHYTCDAPAKVSQLGYQSQGKGVAGHSQALCKGSRPWLGLPARPVARGLLTRGHARLRPCHRGSARPWLACKGQRSPTARPARDDACRRPGRKCSAHDQSVEGRRPQRHRLQAWCLLAHEVPPEGNDTCHRGSRSWTGRPPMARSATTRRGAAQSGQEGLGQSF
ncbi:hypothetical protein BHE74_00046162 [Ensete ventricosum]|nr:hypothetical protein GW17_00037177 [Ensete ventricosum]RWW47814.1 hypothetical protein BHE74_00046162 [Ensete ventricosum]RZS19990.1 hypothetical protein BHM03_00052457 [Ensete ventricosum]